MEKDERLAMIAAAAEIAATRKSKEKYEAANPNRHTRAGGRKDRSKPADKSKVVGPLIPRIGSLGKKELARYIQEELGDGKELADFYLAVLRANGDNGNAIPQGIWLTHRLQAADWLAQRGWGKPKGEEEKQAGIIINITDYARVEVNPPPLAITAEGQEIEIRGPAKFTEALVQQAEVVNSDGGQTHGETKKAETPKLLIEQLNERFEPIEVEVE
jgi:hypothetical protein